MKGRLPVRPTTDFARQALFNILQNHFDFSSLYVLDLYSGTGSIGFEFLSRGSYRVIMVDKNRRCSEAIRSNLTAFNCPEGEVYCRDAIAFLEQSVGSFDIIFADPPYDNKLVTTIPSIVKERKILKAGGWLIIEHASEISFDGAAGFSKKRTYGKVNFSIFNEPS